mgnify:FL=1
MRLSVNSIKAVVNAHMSNLSGYTLDFIEPHSLQYYL